MKERPILFSAPMVQALLNGSKTQTRRVVKQPVDQDERFVGGFKLTGPGGVETAIGGPLASFQSPYGSPGDRLWVRETFADLRGTGIEHRPDPSGPLKRYAFAADHPPGSNGDEARKEFGVKWKPSIHMPRAASRITLEITGVRVERLQDISVADALAEGIVQLKEGFGLPDGSHFHATDPCYSYFSLWEAINGPGSVEANPWVWAVEFKRMEGAQP